MSPERKPWWCSEGCAHAGTGIGLGSAWLPVHSGAAPSAEEASWPGNRKKRRMRLFFRSMAGLGRRDTEVLMLFPALDYKVLK